MTHHSKSAVVFLVPLVLVMTFSMALGQGERGAFNGIVTDATGGTVPGAEVVALNKETNVETKTVTTDAGVYRISSLPPATYKITVSLPGFRTAVHDNVVLRVGQTLTLDTRLEVGEVADQITVSSAAPLLESSTAEISRYVTKTEYDTWPVAVSDGQRQIQQFIFSSLPGTVGGTFQGSINGGQYYSHEILIEGIPLGRFDLQGGSNNEFSPSADAISEFKLQTGTMGAQYTGGQTSVANFAIKSGTNELHGSLFSYVQNDALRANSFTNKAVPPPRGPIKRAPSKLLNYGYAVGGPVYLPKVYDGRDKTFFFTNMEVTRVREFTSTAFSTLPIPAFKRGDFSRLFDPAFTGDARSGTIIGTDALGRPVRFGQIYDVTSTRLVGGVVVRDPFPGNIIPESFFSPVSKNILTQAPITDPLFDRMESNTPNIGTCCPVFDERIFAYKVDHQVNEKHRLSGYYNHTYRLRNNSPGGRWGNPPGTPTGVYQLQYTPGRLVRIAEDWTIGPSVLNHLAIGYNRFGNKNESVFVDQGWPAKIGLQNVAPTHFPTLTFAGTPRQGGGIGAGGRLGSGNSGAGYNGSTIIQDDLTIVRGRHNFKVGTEWRNYYYNNVSKSSSGTFGFDPEQTRLSGFLDTGHSFASFLQGAARSTSRGIALVNPGFRVTQPGFYFSDDWKVNQKLTLNLGLRWEVVGAYAEVRGRSSAIDLTKPNPGAGNIPGALVFAEDLGRKSFQDTYWWMISPRFGFAYAASPKLVFRGGYGINNMPHITNGFSFPSTFGYSGSINLSPANVTRRFNVDPVFFLHERYPDFQGTLPNKNPALANNIGIQYIAPDSNRVAYSQNYNFGVQYELPASMVLEVSYIGNKGTRLEADGFGRLNQVPARFLSLGDKLLERASANPDIVKLPYPGFTGSVAQALRRFPQYTGVDPLQANSGTSHYDSLQVTLTRHLTRSFALLGAYTWSKALVIGSDSAIDGTGIQDVANRAIEKSLTSFNVPHFLKLTWIYELPIGRGKAVDVPRFLDFIIGGWTVTGIHNYRSGSPLSVGQNLPGAAGLALFNGTFRPDIVPGAPLKLDSNATVKTDNTGERYLNPAAFAVVPLTPGGVPRRFGTAPKILSIRGPHQFSEDFGIRKRFNFTETANFELRGDFFNAFNRAGRGNPNTNISSTNFGRISGPQRGPRNIQIEARVNF